MSVDVTSGFIGLTANLEDLVQQVTQLGWKVIHVKFDKKNGHYIAKARSPHGEEVEKTGNNEKRAVSNLLVSITKKHYMRTAAQWKVGMWSPHHWVDQLQPIAEAYSKANIYDPKAAAAFHELGQDSVRRYNALKQHLNITETDDPEPYRNAQEMIDDITKRRRYQVSRANCDHPIWDVPTNVAFRAVHDILGHAVSGGNFDWQGENQACAAHFPLLSENAQKALFTECLGQTGYAGYYRGFGPQKVVLFPQFVEPIQQRENAGPGYAGVHPSQSFPPVTTPAVKPEVYEPEYPGIPPHLDGLGLANYVPGADTHIFSSAKFSSPFTDPNANWTSGFTPMVPNAYLDHGDPLESQAITDNARLIDTEWSKLNQEDPGGLALMKQAIVNAFRVVLLSPLKNLKANAIHYQDISGIPGDVSDPGVYWNTLESARQNHNVKHFGEEHRFDHMVYAPFVKPFESITYQMNPQLGWQGAQKKAKQLMFDWQTEEQERISAEDKDKPEEKRRLADEVERRANEALAKRLQLYIKEFQPKLDFTAAAQNTLFEPPQPIATNSPERYPAFIGNHLKSISQVSGHVNDILKAALEDVHNHDGSGHHFRAAVMQLGIPGVGPKVCSFAWLLLQPMTSQLGTIDTHMVDALGHNYQTDMNNRDYFRMERELAAGRDAAGYGHLPLGQFQWGMWDLKRSGQGTHSDHSALKVLNPTPHDAIDWVAKMSMPRGESWQKIAPDWWKNTQPHRDAVANDWDTNVAPFTPQNQIPWGASDPTYQFTSSVKLAEALRSPWFIDPKTGLHTTGAPGQTIMQHATTSLGLSTPEVWDALRDAEDGSENAGKAS